MEFAIRIGLLIAGLFLLWLLMSGIYKPLIIGFGVISSVLSVYIIHRLGLISEKGLGREFKFIKSIKYVFWLIVEVGRSDWAVTKLILAKKPSVQQRLIGVPIPPKSDFAKTFFATSITLTPGTVTVETETNRLIVHALTDEAADQTALLNMGNKIADLEHQIYNGGSS